MIWDARKLSDWAYHRRRFLSALFVTVLFAGLLVLRSTDVVERGWRASDVVLIGTWLVAILYFGWMAKFELGEMRKAKNG